MGWYGCLHVWYGMVWYVCMYAYVSIYLYLYACVRVYTHACIRILLTAIYMYTHTHIRASRIRSYT